MGGNSYNLTTGPHANMQTCEPTSCSWNPPAFRGSFPFRQLSMICLLLHPFCCWVLLTHCQYAPHKNGSPCQQHRQSGRGTAEWGGEGSLEARTSMDHHRRSRVDSLPRCPQPDLVGEAGDTLKTSQATPVIKLLKPKRCLEKNKLQLLQSH